MKISFHKPSDPSEAIRLKNELGSGAFFLAGGTELNSSSTRLRPRALIDLSALGMDTVRRSERHLSVGAMCRLQELLDQGVLPPVLRRAAMRIENRNIRNQATIGGHVANKRTDANLIPALLALDAAVRGLDGSASPFTMPLSDYLAALEPLLLTSIEIPNPTAGRGFSEDAFSRSSVARSTVVVAASLSTRNGRAVDPIVALGGIEPVPTRLRDLETSLATIPFPAEQALRSLVSSALPSTPASDDNSFRSYLMVTMATSCILKAFASATEDLT